MSIYTVVRTIEWTFNIEAVGESEAIDIAQEHFEKIRSDPDAKVWDEWEVVADDLTLPVFDFT